MRFSKSVLRFWSSPPPHLHPNPSFLIISEHIFAPWTGSTGLETGCKPVLLIVNGAQFQAFVASFICSICFSSVLIPWILWKKLNSRHDSVLVLNCCTKERKGKGHKRPDTSTKPHISHIICSMLFTYIAPLLIL